MILYVIHELDQDDTEKSVIGVADSVDESEKMIEKYYGPHKVLSKEVIEKDGIEYTKMLKVKGPERSYIVDITIQSFVLNEI